MSDSKKDPQAPVRSEHGVAYEPKDLRATPIARTIIVLFVVIVGVYIVCAILGFALKARWKVVPGSLPASHELPPDPRLEVEGPAGLRDLRAQEDQLLLNHYAWADSAHTVVRIPIDRAMELVAERGLPARGATQEESK